MPVTNGVGVSKATPLKQKALQDALGHLLGSSVVIARNEGVPCVIGDMTAGPGCDETGHSGSPVILARFIHGLSRRFHYPVQLFCADKNERTLNALRRRLPSYGYDIQVTYFSDQAELLAHIPPSSIGLTYWDPTRYNDLNLDLLALAGTSLPRVDMLLTREALAGYRMQCAPQCHDVATLLDCLRLTCKQRMYIMQYAKHGWWSLGFASNWKSRDDKKLRDLVDVESTEGRRILAMLRIGMQADANEAPRQEPLW